MIFDFKRILLLQLILLTHTIANADWKLIKQYDDEIFGSRSLFVDLNKIEKKQNYLVPIIINRVKANQSGSLSDKGLIEVDCNGKKISQVEAGSFVGPMATGGPISDRFGPVKYGPVPFRSWNDLNEKSPEMFKDIFNTACRRNQ